MEKLLVVVDMQNDFVTGPLGTPEAQAIVPGLVDFIRSFDGSVVYTRDTHYPKYMETQEGKRLPVEHCIKGSRGWNFIDSLVGVFHLSDNHWFEKSTFGSFELAQWIKDYGPFEEIHFVGVCNGICVL